MDFTEISFTIEKSDRIEIIATDLFGRAYQIEAKQHRNAGEYTLQWNGTDAQGNVMPAGVYMITLYGVENQQTLKVVKN